MALHFKTHVLAKGIKWPNCDITGVKMTVGDCGPDVLYSESSGNLGGGQDRTAKSRLSLSGLTTDGLEGWEHWELGLILTLSQHGHELKHNPHTSQSSEEILISVTDTSWTLIWFKRAARILVSLFGITEGHKGYHLFFLVKFSSFWIVTKSSDNSPVVSLHVTIGK